MRANAVLVKQLPETLSIEQGQNLLRELRPYLAVNHSCLVIDCSILRQLDTATLHLLLCCLEEAMKHNGDVRLSGVSPEARTILSSTRVDRLFKIFDLSADAERSFNRDRHNIVPDVSPHRTPDELHR